MLQCTVPVFLNFWAFKESISPAYVAGRYENTYSFSVRAPLDCSKIPVLYTVQYMYVRRKWLSLRTTSSSSNLTRPSTGSILSGKHVHCKKILATFPFPAGMSLTKLSLAWNDLIIPGQVESGKWHPAWNGKIVNLFLQCRKNPSIRAKDHFWIKNLVWKLLEAGSQFVWEDNNSEKWIL